MRAVIGTVISSKPVTLEGAAATVSNFAAVATTRSRPELAVFSARASRAFAELLAFHRSLRSPHPAAPGDVPSTRNRADAAQIRAGTGIGDESQSLGTNRAAGLENGVEREIDVKRKKMKERGEATVENVSERKKSKEAAEGNQSREAELAVRREEPEEMNAGVADNLAPGIDNERDGKRKRRKERVEAPDGNQSQEVELPVRREEMNAGVDGNVAPGIDNERDVKKKKRKERSRGTELAMNATNTPEGGAVHEKRYEGVMDNGALPRIVNAAVDNGVIDNERGGTKKKKKRSRDAELAAGIEDPGKNAVSRLEGADDERDGKRATLKERAAGEEVSMGVVQPEVKVEKEEFAEERSEERTKKKKKREKNKNREDVLKIHDSVVRGEVKLEKEEFGEERRPEERRNREGEVNVDGGGKKRKHLDDKREESGLEGRREPHKSAELGDQSEQHHKKKRRKRE